VRSIRGPYEYCLSTLVPGYPASTTTREAMSVAHPGSEAMLNLPSGRCRACFGAVATTSFVWPSAPIAPTGPARSSGLVGACAITELSGCVGAGCGGTDRNSGTTGNAAGTARSSASAESSCDGTATAMMLDSKWSSRYLFCSTCTCARQAGLRSCICVQL
jgi:hypothetical protein